ncbi:MAG: HXXEE domain-containing protein [archaeon]|nr:HXXEE domain-containing protein [archaeon]
MEIPLNILFWGMEAAYRIHCLDETLAGGGFVNMVRKHFWSDYSAKKFFWFNTVVHIINITSIVLYEILGGTWVIIPLSISWLFVTNGFWHVLGTAMFKEYSPGLMTSPLYWIIMYFIIRYSLLQGNILLSHFVVSIAIGTILTILMIGGLFAQRWLKTKKS